MRRVFIMISFLGNILTNCMFALYVIQDITVGRTWERIHVRLLASFTFKDITTYSGCLHKNFPTIKIKLDKIKLTRVLVLIVFYNTTG
jgi:hypothetical protein